MLLVFHPSKLCLLHVSVSSVRVRHRPPDTTLTKEEHVTSAHLAIAWGMNYFYLLFLYLFYFFVKALRAG